MHSIKRNVHIIVVYFRAMRGVTIDNPPVSFTDNGIIEQVELNILNVRPYKYEKRFRRVVNKWEEVSILVVFQINQQGGKSRDFLQ